MTGYAPSLKQLKEMTDNEVVRQYDVSVGNTVVGTNFYLDEIRYREAAKLTSQVVRLTRVMTFLTVVITIATILNVIVFLNDSPTVPGFLR